MRREKITIIDDILNNITVTGTLVTWVDLNRMAQ